MEPGIVDVDGSLVLELVGPLSSMLILDILPLWTDALLEKMIIGLQREIRDGLDVVLTWLAMRLRIRGGTHIDSPEFLNRVEGDNLL